MTMEKKATFNEVAELYDRVRNRYPDSLFHELIAIAGLTTESRVPEIGTGTGIATLPLAQLGCRIIGIELGEEMADVARRNLAAFPNADIQVGAFEEWQPAAGGRTEGEPTWADRLDAGPLSVNGSVGEASTVNESSTGPSSADRSAEEAEPFNLVMTASAFHWLNRKMRYSKPAELLRPGGHLAIIQYRHVAGGDQLFFDRAQRCYERHMPGTPPGRRLPTPEQARMDTEELESSGLFDPPTVRTWLTEETYSRDQYLDLLSTYPDHRMLHPSERQKLFGCIAELIDRDYAGKVRKCYLNELMIARKRS